MTEAVRKAGAADLVRALPGGYDQIVALHAQRQGSLQIGWQ
ncbi:MAG TPA: hypothetical protein VF516_20615 [Kofleriaceae bacterium]